MASESPMIVEKAAESQPTESSAHAVARASATPQAAAEGEGRTGADERQGAGDLCLRVDILEVVENVALPLQLIAIPHIERGVASWQLEEAIAANDFKNLVCEGIVAVDALGYDGIAGE
jgi:hypothetical protein